MKVAHRDDYDTHAVVGGKGVQEFGIAQTAEFFTVLSNTLYSNKPLAVIREVLCNAWDAQIVAGTTDVPVIITIDEDKLSIRDHGHGIPHDLIHSIYCVYGNSTKENDGMQTGGFGLGSKSPFAYSDHFTVNNHHAGLKTVHAISRGSTLTQGKPDRRVMVSVPTQENGVEVVIPVKNREDMNQFIEIAKDVAAFGEMNVLINGKQVPVVPISTGENNMFLTTRKPRGSFAKINLRYGNVVYPIQPDAEYIGLWKRLEAILNDIPGTGGYGTQDTPNDFVLILQAPANSISVTPSRESLSNTETTIKTIRGLFQSIIEVMQTGNSRFEALMMDEQAKAIDHLWAKGYEDRIMFSENLLKDEFGPKGHLGNHPGYTQITNMVELADYYLRNKKKISDKIKFKLEQQRVELQIAKGFRQKHLLIRYAKIMAKTANMGMAGDMFWDTIFRPLLRHVGKTEGLNPKHLHVVTPNHRGGARHGWTQLKDWTPDNRQFLWMMQSVIIVTHAKLAYEDEWGIMQLGDTVPNNMPRMVYLAPRTKGTKDKAVELFTRLGYKVIDFAAALDLSRAKEPVERTVKVASTYTPKPRNQGLVLLSNNIEKKHQNFLYTAHTDEDAPRSTEYEYVMKPVDLAGRNGYARKFFPWGDDHASQIVSLFGSKIGICVSEPQLEKQRREGKGNAFVYIAETVRDRVINSSEIRAYVENQKGLERRHSHFDTILEMAQHSSVLFKAYGLPSVPAPEDDLIYFRLYESMSNRISYYHKNRPDDGKWEQPIWDAHQVVEGWTASQAYTDLNELVTNSAGLKLLDLYDMLYALRHMSKTHPDYQKKVFIETTVINALAF